MPRAPPGRRRRPRLRVRRRPPAADPPNPRPGRAGIVRSEEAALPELRGHQRVDGARIAPVDCQPDAPDLDGRQSLRQLRPGLSARWWTCRDRSRARRQSAGRPRAAAAAPRRRGRRDSSGSITTSVTPVSALIDSTAFHVCPPSVVLYRPRSPPEDHSGPMARDVDDVRVARIDDDVLDVLGVLEAHPLPRLAGVGRLVDAVAEADAALIVVLAGAEPDDVRVLRDRRSPRRANTSRTRRRSPSRCCRGSRSSTGCPRPRPRTRRWDSSDRRRRPRCVRWSGWVRGCGRRSASSRRQ